MMRRNWRPASTLLAAAVQRMHMSPDCQRCKSGAERRTHSMIRSAVVGRLERARRFPRTRAAEGEPLLETLPQPQVMKRCA
jgi:hypothetical protein